jgi:hypothetical protein
MSSAARRRLQTSRDHTDVAGLHARRDTGVTAPRPRVGSIDAGVALRGVVLPEDAPTLAALAIRMAEPLSATPLACDVCGLAPAGLAAIDTLARIALVCRRRGTSIAVIGAPPELRELIALAGLGGILCPDGASAGEAVG